MEKIKKNDTFDDERVSLSPRLVGQFILWALIALVGWSFISTLQHQTAIAVIEHRLDTQEREINHLRGEYNVHKHTKNGP